jgi:protein associated with RNAse G/E
MLPRVTMRQEKYDQRLGGTWEGYLLPSSATRTSIWTPAGTVMHWFNRDWPMRYHSLQHFWPERWYTINALYQDHDLYAIYGTIIKPPALGEGATYTDLELGLLVHPNFSYEVLHMETFELAAEGLGYPEEVRIGALLALDGLIRSAERRNGPFMTIPLALPRVDLETLSPEELHTILGDFDEAIVRHPA